ncbi:MAG: ATP synthase F1 subunit delta [Phycisphaerales bacterium]|nr:ATP synthase F1 subunit delta [Phycisphaerales bacterium]MCB9858714.1 ATP synthase F1 subunit delta [Phycisphaerales bacterium]MCB9864430.1 ATP synthase F1 subunit delta [Phycisphaerales bacterium]
MATDYNMSQAAAAVYAESLLQAADDAGKTAEIGSQLLELRKLWDDSPDFAAMMSSAAIDDDARRESIRRAFGDNRVDPLVLNLMLVLNDRWRAPILPHVCDAFQAKLNERDGRETVRVASVVALNDEQREKLKAEVKRLTGFDAILDESVDPALIGGLRVQVRDRLFDLSVYRRLRDLRTALHATSDQIIRGDTARFVTEG